MPKAKAKKNSVTKAKSKGKKDASAKLSKALTKFSPLKDLMNSDLGRELLADALIAAAGAAAVALTKSRTVRNAGSATSEASTLAAGAAKDAMQTAAGAVAGVVTEAARHFLPTSLTSGLDEEEAAPRKASRAKSSGKARKPQYAHLASDHSKRKTSRKSGSKASKAEKPH